MERNNSKQNNIKDAIQNISKEEMYRNNFMDLYIVEKSNTYQDVNKKEFTCDIRQMDGIQKFINVPILSQGLGNGKGLMMLPQKDDIVLVSFYGQTNAPIIMGNIINSFTQDKSDNILDINGEEWILINKLNGSYIFTNSDGEILIKNTLTESYTVSSSTYTESFIKLKKDGNIWVQCKGGVGNLSP